MSEVAAKALQAGFTAKAVRIFLREFAYVGLIHATNQAGYKRCLHRLSEIEAREIRQ